MEFPDLGKHCSEPLCKRLDFLPIKCDACSSIFCHEHMKYSAHNCPSAYKKDVQVPVCPLCNQPVPVARNQEPDYVVGQHMDNDCQSQPAQDRRKKVFTNRCSMKGCKQKEVIPVVCPECSLNFCLRHRHTVDHNCEGKEAASRKKAAAAAVSRQKKSTANTNSTKNNKPIRKAPPTSAFQGTISEDEAFARALQESMNGPGIPIQVADVSLSQEEEDRMLAMALAESERDQRRRPQQPPQGNTSSHKSCRVS